MRRDIELMVRYAEVRNRKQSMKVLREWIDFLQQENVDLSESAEHISEFTRTPFYREKSRPTQKNYLRTIKDFVRFVYEVEKYSLYPRFVEREQYPSLREILRDNINTIREEEVEIEEEDEEYKKFLQRYEEVKQ